MDPRPEVIFMSISHFTGARPTPLRGNDLSAALIELLAITRWGELDYLIIDMPPGLGDAALDAVRLLGRAEFLVVATPSRLVLETVQRTLELLAQLGAPLLGVVENFRRQPQTRVAELAASFDLPFLGALPFDAGLEATLGEARQLLGTAFAAALDQVVTAIQQHHTS